MEMIGFFGTLLLKFGLPAIIGAILSAAYLIPLLASLRDLIDVLIAANEDKKISQEEYNHICNNAKVFKDNFNALLLFWLDRLSKRK